MQSNKNTSVFKKARCLSKSLLVTLTFALCFFSSAYAVEDNNTQVPLPELIKSMKPSIVGIGIYAPIKSKAPRIIGSGFVVGNGKHIVTNYHVVSKELDPTIVEHYVALSGEGKQPRVHKMTLVGVDPVHDLAILSIEDDLPPVTLGSNSFADAGTNIVMTGYPIGAVLGLYPATHVGIVAAIAPDINPASNADELTISMLNRLKDPFLIYQLDITAFPGNSGSPIYNRQNGEVIGVLNKVFVSAGKESALTNPSGISYAIPILQLRKLAAKYSVDL
jgi:S1-C subfamily serine protease